jgi:hypothetical protein
VNVVGTVTKLTYQASKSGNSSADLPSAFKSAPLSHATFLGSLIAFEGIFFLYYTSWNLFHSGILPETSKAPTLHFAKRTATTDKCDRTDNSHCRED